MHDSPFLPLAGTGRPARGLFVHRWGTLLARVAPERGSLEFDPALVSSRSSDALFRAQQQGWQVYLIGNEDEVAQGRVGEVAWERFEGALLDHLARQGVRVVRNYACLDHPEGQGRHRRPSVFLLPDTGIFYHAAQLDGIRLKQSWVIGDTTSTLVAGERAGCRTIGVDTGAGCADGVFEIEPDMQLADLGEALRFLTLAAAA
jgi:histidinol phosphatase-like enzyme